MSLDVLKKDIGTISPDEQLAIIGGETIKYHGYASWDDFVNGFLKGEYIPLPGETMFTNPDLNDSNPFWYPSYTGEPGYYGAYGYADSPGIPSLARPELHINNDGSATYQLGDYEENLFAAHHADALSFFKGLSMIEHKLSGSGLDAESLFTAYASQSYADINYASLINGHKQLVSVNLDGTNAQSFIQKATNYIVGQLGVSNPITELLPWVQDGGMVMIGNYDTSHNSEHWYVVSYESSQQNGFAPVYTITDTVPDSNGNYSVTYSNYPPSSYTGGGIGIKLS